MVQRKAILCRCHLTVAGTRSAKHTLVLHYMSNIDAKRKR